MREHFFKLSLLAVLLTPFSCKTIDNQQIDALYMDPTPREGETLTQARMRALSIYANDLLSDYQVVRDKEGNLVRVTDKLEPLHKVALADFKQRGIDGAPYLPLNKEGNPATKTRGHYHLFIDPYSDKCFYEGKMDRDLYWNDHRDQIKQQIYEVAKFLKDFHVAIGGDVNQSFVPFDVEICSRKETGWRLLWDSSGKLIVGVPYWTWFAGGNFKPVSASTLMSDWNSGRVLSATNAEEAAAKALWPILNPAGEFHRKLYDKLRAWRDTSKQNISKNKVSARMSLEAFKQLLNRHVAFDRLDVKLDDVLNKASTPEQREKILNAWEEALSNPDRINALASASIPAVSERIKVKNRSNGWIIGVANYHRIGVQVAADLNNQGRYLRVDIPRTVDIDMECNGLFTSCTIDDVTVLVSFVQNQVGFELSVETSAFAEAIRNTLGL